MNITLDYSQIIVWLIVGALAGSIAGMLVKRTREGFGPFTNLGIGLVGALIGGFIFKALKGEPLPFTGAQNASRDFTYVDDIARGTISALKPLGYEIINLGGHEPMTINDLIGSLERIIGNPAKVVKHPPHPADMLTSQADVSKAKSLLDWEPQVSLEDGIRKLVQWYQQERSWTKDIKTE